MKAFDVVLLVLVFGFVGCLRGSLDSLAYMLLAWPGRAVRCERDFDDIATLDAMVKVRRGILAMFDQFMDWPFKIDSGALCTRITGAGLLTSLISYPEVQALFSIFIGGVRGPKKEDKTLTLDEMTSHLGQHSKVDSIVL